MKERGYAVGWGVRSGGGGGGTLGGGGVGVRWGGGGGWRKYVGGGGGTLWGMGVREGGTSCVGGGGGGTLGGCPLTRERERERKREYVVVGGYVGGFNVRNWSKMLFFGHFLEKYYTLAAPG